MPNLSKREEAFRLFEEYGGFIRNETISKALNVSPRTLCYWKKADNWVGRVEGAPAKIHVGNPKPSYKFPKGNQLKTTHGLFSNFLPPETQVIAKAVEESTSEERLWSRLITQYTAILYAYRVMHVEDANDHIKINSKNGEGIAFAYERYGDFLQSLSRASAEYRAIEKLYMTSGFEDEERALKLQKMRAEISKIEGGKEDGSTQEWKGSVIEAAKRRKEMKEDEQKAEEN